MISAKSFSDKGVFQSSFTSQSPPFLIFSFGEYSPNQFFEGIHSTQWETVEIIFDSSSSRLSLFSTEKTTKLKFSWIYAETSSSVLSFLSESLLPLFASFAFLVVKSSSH